MKLPCCVEIAAFADVCERHYKERSLYIWNNVDVIDKSDYVPVGGELFREALVSNRGLTESHYEVGREVLPREPE